MLKTVINLVRKRISTIPEIKKVSRNVSWLMFEKVLRYSVSLFVGVWIARYLGPDKYGIFSYVIAYTALFNALADLGLKGIVVRELVKNTHEKNLILGSAFVMLLLSGIVTWVIATVSIYLIRPEDILSVSMVAIISAGFLFQPLQVFAYFFESKIESKYIVIATNSSFLLCSLIKIILILTNQSLIAFAIVAMAEILIVGVNLFIAFKWKNQQVNKLKFDFSIAKDLLKDSYPLILSGIMISLYMKIDQLMLRELTNDRETGLYSIAVKLTELWYFIPIIIQSSIFPILSKSMSETLLLERMHKFFLTMVIISVGIAIPISIGSPYIIKFLFGLEYAEANLMLIISIWALLFVSLGVARNSYLLIKNYIKQSFYFTLIGVIINILLNLVLLPKYGGIGAAITTLISYAVSAYFSTFLYKPLIPLANRMTRSLFLLKPASAHK